jgi:hypothetical protein
MLRTTQKVLIGPPLNPTLSTFKIFFNIINLTKYSRYFFDQTDEFMLTRRESKEMIFPQKKITLNIQLLDYFEASTSLDLSFL